MALPGLRILGVPVIWIRCLAMLSSRGRRSFVAEAGAVLMVFGGDVSFYIGKSQCIVIRLLWKVKPGRIVRFGR